MKELITENKFNSEVNGNFYGEINSSDRALWQRIVSDWLSSDLSQQAFCHRYGLNKNTLSYWRGKFLAEEKKPNEISKKPAKVDGALKSKFVPLTVTPSQPVSMVGVGSALDIIELRSVKGHVLRLPLSLGQEGLKQLLSFMG